MKLSVSIFAAAIIGMATLTGCNTPVEDRNGMEIAGDVMGTCGCRERADAARRLKRSVAKDIKETCFLYADGTRTCQKVPEAKSVKLVKPLVAAPKPKAVKLVKPVANAVARANRAKRAKAKDSKGKSQSDLLQVPKTDAALSECRQMQKRGLMIDCLDDYVNSVPPKTLMYWYPPHPETAPRLEDPVMQGPTIGGTLSFDWTLL